MWAAVVLAAFGAVPLIVDTDIGGGGCMDVDDVAALCIANALEDLGEARVAGVVQNSSPPKCAGVISVINTYYGRESIPIGAYKGPGLEANATYLPYVDELINNFPSPIKNSSQVPDSVSVYKDVLSKEEDNSVVVVSIGMLTNLAELFKSPGGLDLFSKKVKLLAVMGGAYPTSELMGSECNFCGCAHETNPIALSTAQHATAYVVEHTPANVQVLFSGFEVGIRVESGAPLDTCAPASSPCRAAFVNYCGAGKSRFSWDPLTLIAAVRGPAGVGTHDCKDCAGHNYVNASSGTNAWKYGTASNQTYLILENATAASDALNTLLCHQPSAKP
eukprot:Hpha_TRINITY_DN12563_c0_g1::TRINITY_DN12563_c0_g1_i1::g.50767::m.50767